MMGKSSSVSWKYSGCQGKLSTLLRFDIDLGFKRASLPVEGEVTDSEREEELGSRDSSAKIGIHARSQ